MNAVWTDHARIRVDLGDEPPIRTTDTGRTPPDRHAVSLRWLASTVLAACASTLLMSGALYAALDGRPDIGGARPIFGPKPLFPAANGEIVGKTDFPDVDRQAGETRRILRLGTIARDGDRDIIRMRPFARVTAPLVQTTDALVDGIPAFDPLRIFAEANAASPAGMRNDTLYGADVESEMAVKISDFPVDDRSLPAVSALSEAALETIVREQAGFLTGSKVEVAALPFADPSRFDYSFSAIGGIERLGVRIIPENVSFVAKSGDMPAAGDYREEKLVLASKGDTIESLMLENEATDDEALEINSAFRDGFGLAGIAPGEKLRIVLAPAADEETERYQPISVSLYREGRHVATVALSDDLAYVPAQEPAGGVDVASGEEGAESGGRRPRLYASLYQTALDNDVGPRLIDELVHVISYDVDFNSRVAPGDSIDMLYSLSEDARETAGDSEIVFCSITLGGRTHRYYRFRDPTDGSVDYYDADGNNAKKFLMRKPMSVGTFRRGFGMQRHPLLGYARMHTGVDWAAPRGTSIMAAGDGEVVKAGWMSGYGNYIEVRHANGYATAYGHMTGYAKGMRAGVRVKQGQVIGYVGSTGLSTGPHLHFEIMVNDRQVDPMRIRLPEGRSLDGEALASFEIERRRIDALVEDGAQPTFAAAEEGPAGG